MLAFGLLCALLQAPPPPASAPASAAVIEVRVDPRVELLALVFRLAGHPEYNMPVSISPYSEEVDEHFEAFGRHPVVEAARRLRAERGVSYDAVMSMAVHLDGAFTLAERVPFDLPPARLDSRWRPDEARAFVADLRDFVRVSGFEAFANAHADFYERSAARLAQVIAQRDYVGWFDRFFGPRPAAHFTAIGGLLCGGGNFGVGVRFPDGREEITPVFGAHRFDLDGLPLFEGPFMPGLIAHELCHTYTNPLVDRHAGPLQAAGQRIYATCAAQMQRQAYGDWRIMLYESLVRACVVRYVADHDGPDAAARQIEFEHAAGFRWTGALAELLKEYAADRPRYPDFDAFMPRIVAFFDDWAAQLPDAAAAPRVLELVPPAGARDVDPQLTELRITFDRPMRDKSWSVVRYDGAGVAFPELGQPAYDAERRVLTLPVRLQPRTEYVLWLNSDRFQGFKSEAGVPLTPCELRFTTR